jgi:threonine dehydratase
MAIEQAKPTLGDLLAARRRIEVHIHRTPVLTSRYFDQRVGAQVFFKCENFQKVGAFKARGACNAVFSLSDEEAARGVITHSSGNHAQALAYAAGIRGIAAHVVMPRTAPKVKSDAVAGYGAEIRFCEPTLEAREEASHAWMEETGACFVHPFDDWAIIAGQSTAAQELLEEIPDLDLVLTPVGGGGLLSGTALACSLGPGHAKALGAEPENADDAARSLALGAIQPSIDPRTVADGLLTSLGVRNFEVIREHVSTIWTVSEAEIIEGMRLIWQRMKILIEPSSAVPVAALLASHPECNGQRIGIILSGGNVDPLTVHLEP